MINYTSRSAIETFQRCPRRWYYQNGYQGRGITPVSLSIPLATGSSVHRGLELILKDLQFAESKHNKIKGDGKKLIADYGSFFEYNDPGFQRSIEAAVGVATKGYQAEMEERGFHRGQALNEFDAYTIEEQVALIEALIRAFAIQVAPQLIKEYKILDIEREETYILNEEFQECSLRSDQIILQAKCDAILQRRSDKEIVLISFKTTKSYTDPRKEKSAEHDTQGMSETVCINDRLGEEVKEAQDFISMLDDNFIAVPKWSQNAYLKLKVWALNHAPMDLRVAGVQMVYLLKGLRLENPKGSGRWIDYSPLIRGYKKLNKAIDDYEYAWSYEFPNPNNDSGLGRLGKGWERFDVWKEFEGGVKGWIELLCKGQEDSTGAIVPLIQPDCGWALANQIVMPAIINRSDEEINGWLEATKHQVNNCNRNLSLLNDADCAKIALDRNAIMNQCFPMYRHSCHYPSDCDYVKICYDSEIRENPLSVTDPDTGRNLYQWRKPHHEPEERAHQELYNTEPVKEIKNTEQIILSESIEVEEI